MQSKKRKKNKTNKTSKLVIILILIIAIIVLLFVAKNKKIDNSNSSENTTQSDTSMQENQVTEEKQENQEFVKEEADGSKVNTSSKLKETKNLDGLKITNISLKETGGITTLLANVENTTGGPTTGKTIKIQLLDKEGNKITELTGIIDPMEAGEKNQLNVSVTTDVSNAYDFIVTD